MTPSERAMVLTCWAPSSSVSGYQLISAAAFYGVTQILVAANGAGNYTSAPTVTVAGGTKPATAHAVMRYEIPTPNNYVSFIYIDDPGIGYDPAAAAPLVTFSGGGQVTSATANATVGAVAGIHLNFTVVDYSFKRTTTWATNVQRFKDQTSIEILPYQAIAMYEFTVHSTRWQQSDVNTLESIVDQAKGAAFPMWITAPDDGQIYNVRFKQDPQGYAAPLAVVRTGDLVLTTIGDIDNSIDNWQAYPPPINPGRRTHVSALR
jgi:hypothetical protein